MNLLLSASLLTSLPACTQSQPTDRHESAATTQPATAKPHDSSRWEKDIAAFEAMDRTSPPPKGGVLFIGSSTIRLWKTLATDFPNHQVINRGFGGSHIADSTNFAERIIFPYEPRMIFLRAGGNDIHAGKSPEQVFEDYKAFVAKVHARLPKTPIVYITACPTPSRWADWDKTSKLHALIKAYTRWRSYLKFVDTDDMTLGANGLPREDLFVKDRLHLNAEGYLLLADRVRPALPK
jgi:lysophospholipase L1-like esterase